MQNLPSVLTEYRQALQHLKTVSQPKPSDVLDVLTLRDRIQDYLATDEQEIPSDALLRIHELDQLLKQQTPTVVNTLDLSEWQTLLQPPTEAWWWYLELPPEKRWWNQYDWFWNAITIAALTAAASIWMDTTMRFFKSGISTMGALAVLSEFVLAGLTVAGTLTQKGREILYGFYQRLKIPSYYWQEMGSLLAVLLFVVVAAVHSALPRIAEYVTWRGVEQYEQGQFDSAITEFRHAIALRPDYPPAHFQLGLVYTDLQQYEEATAQLQRVAQPDTKINDPVLWLQAMNQLGKVALRQDDAETAVMVLEQGLNALFKLQQRTDIEIAPDELAPVRYGLLTHLAQARIRQEQYAEAASLAQDAIALDDTQPEAHCVLAHALGFQDQIQPAISAFQTCEQAIDPNDLNQNRLLQMTLEQLRQRGMEMQPADTP
ncbi:MAG: tetratricopeptide repeat protein [Thainema sp.]